MFTGPKVVALGLLAPVLALAVTATSALGVRCRMTGLVSVDALDAGGGEAAPADAPAQSTVDEPGCCDRVVVGVAKPAGVVVAALGAPAPALVAALDVPEVAPPPPRARAPRSTDRARAVGPPLRLLKRSFLI
jgi:hypothetical protein